MRGVRLWLVSAAALLLLSGMAAAAGRRITSGSEKETPAAPAPEAPEPGAEPELAPVVQPPTTQSPAHPAPGAGAWAQALSDFRRDFSSVGLFGPRLSSSHRMILSSTDAFLVSGAADRKRRVLEACLVWQRSLRAAGIEEEAPYVMVVWPAGGGLWRCEGPSLRQVENWADDHLDMGESDRSGRLFGFVGGQMVVGGLVDQKGMNARLGTTLFHDRYDLAVSYGHETVDTVPKYSSNSYGLVGRALFPLTEAVGWNIGLQGNRAISSNGGSTAKTDTISALGGLNFYMPGGSVDVTVNVGNHSTYGLLVGYTVYLTK